MHLLFSVTFILAFFRHAETQIQPCQLGYAVLVPCSTTSKHLSSDTTDVYCPAGCMSKNLSVWGTDIYTEDTPVCLAAIHVGIGSNGGGHVTVQKLPGQAKYLGSIKNGISSLSYTTSARSFLLFNTTTTTTTTASLTTAESTTTTASPPTAGLTTSTAAATTDSLTAAPTFTTASSSPTNDNLAMTVNTQTETAMMNFVDIGLITCDTYLDIVDWGDPLRALCPEGCDTSQLIWGTDIYSSDSNICLAAIHAGAMPVTGGYVTLKREPLQSTYLASYQNGIQSYNSYLFGVRESFVFILNQIVN
ncbi:cysteine-rich secretory protein LCCL domain-containing 1-like [Mixophyes fleayi]|uniref:cysteine-rich secretory protein LCCL domain-containing 1-like n=1 Tax=Mixophyes fleayi TaxID=3061075 RepID=UPI003F4E02C3